MKSPKELPPGTRQRLIAKTRGLKAKVEHEITQLLIELRLGTVDGRKLKAKLHKARKRVAEIPNHDI
jgi:hypothetical protein